MKIVDAVNDGIPKVLDQVNKLIGDKKPKGILTLTFLESGAVVESSDLRFVDICELLGALELVKFKTISSSGVNNAQGRKESKK